MIFDVGPPPNLWIPQKPAIIRSCEPIARPSSANVMFINAWLTQSTGGVITFVGSSTANAVNGGNVSLDLSGIGLAENDIVVVANAGYLLSAGTESNMEPTSNTYTMLALVDPLGQTPLYVGYKRMTSSPDTSLTFTGSGETSFAMASLALAFRGVSTTTAIDVTTTTNSSSFDPPSITPVSNNACVVAIGAAIGGNSGDASPGSITDFLPSPVITSIGTDDQTAQVCAAYRIRSGGASVAENPGNFSTWSQPNPDAQLAVTLALRPA